MAGKNNNSTVSIDDLARMIRENMVTKTEWGELERCIDRLEKRVEGLDRKVEDGFGRLNIKLDKVLGAFQNQYDELASRVKRLEEAVFKRWYLRQSAIISHA